MIPDPFKVSGRQEFVEFVTALREDLRQNASEWENPTLDSFLEALAAYGNDAPGYLRNVGSSVDPEEPSWELFALVLAGARSYE